MSRRRRIGLTVADGLVLAAMVVLALDRIFPPGLNRMVAMGTEVRDRQGRTLALLPARGGVWRFRAPVETVPPPCCATC